MGSSLWGLTAPTHGRSKHRGQPVPLVERPGVAGPFQCTERWGRHHPTSLESDAGPGRAHLATAKRNMIRPDSVDFH